MYTFEGDNGAVEPGRKVLFRVEALRQANGLRERSPFLARVVEEVAEVIPFREVWPDECAEYALRAADRVQEVQGNVSDELYQRVGDQVLALCERAAGSVFREQVERSVEYQLAFTPYEERFERHV